MEWTGTWADPRFSAARRRRAPAERAHRPAVHRQLRHVGHHGPVDVQEPAAVAEHGRREPRRRAVEDAAPGDQTLGYEWDIDADNGFRPRGQFQLSSTTVSGVESFTDYGSNVAAAHDADASPDEYKAPSGALVFGAGTVQWAWGLDDTNAWNANGPRRHGARPRHAAGDGQPVRGHGRAAATTLMSGLTRRLASRPTRRRPTRRSQPGGGRGDRRRRAGDDLRHRDRRAAAGGRRRGLDRRRHHVASGHRDDVLDLQLERPRLADARRSWRARSTTRGNLESAVAERERQRRLPVHAGRPDATPGRSSTSRTPTRSRSACGSRPTSTAGSPASASTRRRRTPARTSATSGRRAGRCSATGTFTGETASGWQQMTFTTPGRHHRGTTYVASYFAPRGHYSVSSELLLLARPGRRELARQPAAARDQRQRRRRQRRLLLRRRVDVPDVDLQRRELRRRRRLRAQAAAGRGGQRHGDAGSRLGDGQLHGAGDRRRCRRATSSRRSSARRRRRRSP